MAEKQNPNWRERTGEFLGKGGLVAALIGAIGIIASSEFAASLFLPGVVIFAAGEGLKRTSPRKNKAQSA